MQELCFQPFLLMIIQHPLSLRLEVQSLNFQRLIVPCYSLWHCTKRQKSFVFVALLYLPFLHKYNSQMKFLRDSIADLSYNLIDRFRSFLQFFRKNIYHIRGLRLGLGILLVILICFLPAIQPYGAVLGGWFLLVLITSLLSRWI